MFIMRFALKVWQRFSQGRTRATSSFRKYENLERERERERGGGEEGEQRYINLPIIAEFFHNPTLFYSDTLLNTLSPISYVTQWSLAVLITFNSISQLVLIS